MIDTVPSHETAPAPEQGVWDNMKNSMAAKFGQAYETVKQGVTDTAGKVADGVAGAYGWTKGEVKGAFDTVTGVADSLVFKVGLAAGLVLLAWYFIVKGRK